MAASKAAIVLSENYLRSGNSVESCTVRVALHTQKTHVIVFLAAAVMFQFFMRFDRSSPDM